MAASGTAAGATLGELLHTDSGADVASVEASIRAAIADSAGREARAATVAAVCAPEAVAARLRDLAAGLLDANAAPPFDPRLLAQMDACTT